jgi:hypothetical protein
MVSQGIQQHYHCLAPRRRPSNYHQQRHQRHILSRVVPRHQPPGDVSDSNIYIYRKTKDKHGKVLNEGYGQDTELLDVQSDNKVTKIIIKIKADTNLEMHIGKEFAIVDTYRARWTGHVKAVIKDGNKNVEPTGTAWFEEGDFSKESPLPKPNPPERVYVERDGKVRAKDLI